MRCRAAQRTASRAIDGAASTAEVEALAAHVASCESCRLAVEKLSRAWGALAPLEKMAPAPDDWTRIEAALEARQRRWTPPWESWFPAPFRPAVAWALAAMVALGATGGALLSRVALAPPRASSVEAIAFAETLGDLPWASPAAGLARPLLAAVPARETR
jgi:predicted anti-sigma-YlaC factor YlaD